MPKAQTARNIAFSASDRPFFRSDTAKRWISQYTPVDVDSLITNSDKIKEVAKFLSPFRRYGFPGASGRSDDEGTVGMLSGYKKTEARFSPSGNFGKKKSRHAAKPAQLNSFKLDEFINNDIEVENPPFICILRGPSGCGKRVTLDILCHYFGIEVVEWDSPASSKDIESSFSNSYTNKPNYSDNFCAPKLSDEFIQFFNQCHRRPILDMNFFNLYEEKKVNGGKFSQNDSFPAITQAKCLHPKMQTDNIAGSHKRSKKYLENSFLSMKENFPPVEVSNIWPEYRVHRETLTAKYPSVGKTIISNHVTLIPEIPRTLIEHSKSFVSRIQEYFRNEEKKYTLEFNTLKGKKIQQPIVILIRDTFEEQQLLNRFFPVGFLENPCVVQISFNPVPRKAMTKLLRQILLAEGYNSQDLTVERVLENVIASSNGDIRFALNTIQFALLGHNSSVSTLSISPSNLKSTHSKNSIGNFATCKEITEDSNEGDFLSMKGVNLSAYHIVGKFLWNKRIQNSKASSDSSFSTLCLTKDREPSILLQKEFSKGNSEILNSKCQDINFEREKVSRSIEHCINDYESEDLQNFLISLDFVENVARFDTEADEIENVVSCMETGNLTHRVTFESYGKNSMPYNSKPRKSVRHIDEIMCNQVYAYSSVKHGFRILEAGLKDYWGWAVGLPQRLNAYALNATKEVKDISKQEKNICLPVQHPPEKLFPKHSRPQLYFIPENVLENSNTSFSYIISLLQQNYVYFYDDICDVAAVSSNLTFCDKVFGSHINASFGTSFDDSFDFNDCKTWYFCSAYIRAILDCNLHNVAPATSGPFKLKMSRITDTRNFSHRNSKYLKDYLTSVFDLEYATKIHNVDYISCLQLSLKKWFTEVLPSLYNIVLISSEENSKVSSIKRDLKDYIKMLNIGIVDTMFPCKDKKGHFQNFSEAYDSIGFNNNTFVGNPKFSTTQYFPVTRNGTKICSHSHAEKFEASSKDEYFDDILD